MRHPIRNTVVIATAAVAVPLSLALFSVSGPAAAGGEPKIASIPVLRNLDGDALPLERYALSGQDLIKVYRARRTLQQSCIRSVLGNVYLGDFGERIPAPADASTRPIRSLDPSITARAGYHDPTEPPATGKVERTPNVLPNIMHEALEIAHGSVSEVAGKSVPKGGCIAAAERKLTKGVSSRLDPRTLILEADAKTSKDSRFRQTTKKWSACMNHAGFTYQSLDQASNDPHWSMHDTKTQKTASITTQEVKVATADAKCRQATNIYGVWVAVESAYQEQTVRKMGSRLQAAEQAQQQLLRNAQAVLR